MYSITRGYCIYKLKHCKLVLQLCTALLSRWVDLLSPVLVAKLEAPIRIIQQPHWLINKPATCQCQGEFLNLRQYGRRSVAYAGSCCGEGSGSTWFIYSIIWFIWTGLTSYMTGLTHLPAVMKARVQGPSLGKCCI